LPFDDIVTQINKIMPEIERSQEINSLKLQAFLHQIMPLLEIVRVNCTRLGIDIFAAVRCGSNAKAFAATGMYDRGSENGPELPPAFKPVLLLLDYLYHEEAEKRAQHNSEEEGPDQ
jgi:hypothetical protein